MAIHAYSLQDAYIYGFALQEKDLAFEAPDSAGRAARKRAETIDAPERYPYLVEIATKLQAAGTTAPSSSRGDSI